MLGLGIIIALNGQVIMDKWHRHQWMPVTYSHLTTPTGKLLNGVVYKDWTLVTHQCLGVLSHIKQTPLGGHIGEELGFASLHRCESNDGLDVPEAFEDAWRPYEDTEEGV